MFNYLFVYLFHQYYVAITAVNSGQKSATCLFTCLWWMYVINKIKLWANEYLYILSFVPIFY